MRSKLPAIGGALALLAGVGILAAIWSNGTKHSAACAPHITAPVPAAAKKALAGYTGRIIHDVQHSTSGTRDESWEDPVTGSRQQVAFGAQGRIESMFGTTRDGSVERTVWVLYPARRVLITNHPVPANLQPHGSRAAEAAQANRDEVANGTATILGRAVIDGRQTLHLHQTIHPAAPPPPNGMPLPNGFHFPAMPAFNVDTWVDPLTYLPVRTRFGGFGRQGSSSITDETWLPRTPANIAKTKVVIPLGFKHVVPNQRSGVAFSSGTDRLVSSSCQS